jgi:ParB family chromosome partitioning protein
MPKAMETARRRTALGQGLDALIPLDDIAYLSSDVLFPNPHQPRSVFPEDSLADLSRSIQERGVIQPLIVRPTSEGKYEIVAGERRWRAATMAGFKTVPAIVKNLTDSETLEIALVENLQREDLNPLDTAEAYDTLVKKFSYTHEDLARRIGKDRSNITNYLRLLKLPEPIKEHLRLDRITMGHARTLLAVDNIHTQLTLSAKIIKRKLSVRDLERIVQNYKNRQPRHPVFPTTDPVRAELEKGLSRQLATKVVVRTKNNQSGKLEIYFHSREELDRLLEVLGYREDFS